MKDIKSKVDIIGVTQKRGIHYNSSNTLQDQKFVSSLKHNDIRRKGWMNKPLEDKKVMTWNEPLTILRYPGLRKLHSFYSAGISLIKRLQCDYGFEEKNNFYFSKSFRTLTRFCCKIRSSGF